MSRHAFARIAPLLSLCAVLSAVELCAQSLPPIEINQNHNPAGVLRDGVLTIQLQAARGEWHPESEDGLALGVYAFGEVGHPLQNPGPLIRVPQGTEIRASVRNTLDVPLNVHGLGDAIRLTPGGTEQIHFKATTPGLYFYWGALDGSDDVMLRKGVDAELTGALVVDPANAAPRDEIFVIEMISDRAGPGSTKILATINGKSWPYTQRFQYDIGEQVRWRWIDATNEPHAMHLHGFYFHVDAFNHNGRLETFTGNERPFVVTQRIAPGETFDMSWSPDRPGRWLMHCHMMVHMTPSPVPEEKGITVRQAAAAADPHAEMGDAAGMSQLVLGITVPAAGSMPPKAAWRPERKLQLIISERQGAPRYALQLREDGQPADSGSKAGLIGPPIVLTRGQPVEIEVVNRLPQPTAIHWHGIELESYYDGVPGWTGDANQSTPPIAPGSSFVAHMTPPRAGTFIYHTHWHDDSQLTNGIYGPLIVLPPGQQYDPASDLTFVFSIGDFGQLGELSLINGTPQSKTLMLRAGTRYRFRLINISTNNQAFEVSLQDAHGPVEWRIVAKDGADLPPDIIQPSKARLTVTVGETYDVEYSSAEPRDLLLQLLAPRGKVRTTQTLVFAAASAAQNAAPTR